MTCPEFKKQLHDGLDWFPHGDLPHELEEHLAECSQCRSYAASFAALHRALYNLPRIDPSLELIASLKAIARNQRWSPARISWMPEVRLAVALFAPLALPFIMRAYSLDVLGLVLEVAIQLVGLTLLLTVILKPRILGGPKDRLVPGFA